MSEQLSPTAGPSDDEIKKDITYLDLHNGGEWQPVEPAQVSVRRSSGAIDKDWFAIGYDTQNDLYAVRKTDGTLKTVASVDFGSLNAGLLLSLPSHEKLAARQTPLAMIEGTRDAIAALGVDDKLKAGLLDRMHLVATDLAKKLDRTHPELGRNVLEQLLAINGGRVDLNDEASLARYFSDPAKMANLLAPMGPLLAAVQAGVEELLNREMFGNRAIFRGMKRASINSPVLRRELEMKCFMDVLKLAHDRELRSR